MTCWYLSKCTYMSIMESTYSFSYVFLFGILYKLCIKLCTMVHTCHFMDVSWRIYVGYASACMLYTYHVLTGNVRNHGIIIPLQDHVIVNCSFMDAFLFCFLQTKLCLHALLFLMWCRSEVHIKIAPQLGSINWIFNIIDCDKHPDLKPSDIPHFPSGRCFSKELMSLCVFHIYIICVKGLVKLVLSLSFNVCVLFCLNDSLWCVFLKGMFVDFRLVVLDAYDQNVIAQLNNLCLYVFVNFYYMCERFGGIWC